MKSFNEFTQNLETLERRTGGASSRIELLVKNDPEMRRLVGWFYFWDRRFESNLAKHPFVRNVPSWFLERYRSYKEQFSAAVDGIYGDLFLRTLFEDQVDGVSKEEILQPRTSTALNHEDEWSVPGGAAAAVEEMFDLTLNISDSSDHGDDIRTGLAAWTWFESTVGLNLGEIELRWNAIPRALIPSHLERANATAVDELADLLDDAARAYVFGLHAAAFMTCRSVCERVLTDFYGVRKKKEENHKGLALLAEEKYPRLRELNLNEQWKQANAVVHAYRRDQLSEEQLTVVRQFLATVKSLIEQAPDRNT